MKSRHVPLTRFIALAAALLLFPVTGSSWTLGPRVSSTEEIFGWIEDICDLGYRRPGTEAEHLAEAYVRDRFIEFGLTDVRLEPIDITLWEAESWSLTVDEEQIPSFYMPYSELTGPAGIRAEIVYVGEGSEEEYATVDVQGKIVIADIRFLKFEIFEISLMHPYSWVMQNWDAYYRARDNGAVGFIGILRDYWDRNTFYYPTDSPSKPLFKELPGMWVTKSDGDRILAKLSAAGAEQAQMVLCGQVRPAVTSNVVGVLPGLTDDIILVHTHHDAAFLGAVEDASGVAEVLALAKYYAQIPEYLRVKTMVFLTATGHFYNYLGNAKFVEKHLNDLIPHVVVDFCIEHAGKEYAEVNGEIAYTGNSELSGLFVTSPVLVPLAAAATVAHGVDRTIVLPWPFEDFYTDAIDYHAAGIPVVSLISGPEYIYDLIDTPDKVDQDQLRPIARAFIDMIDAVDILPASVITTW